MVPIAYVWHAVGMRMMALVPALFLLASTSDACETALRLEGMESIEVCEAGSRRCRPASEVVHDYASRFDDGPATLSIALTASPWHFYDGDMRILAVEDLAARIRPAMTPQHERVLLVGSWTGAAPEGNVSLAERLSAALDGFAVQGMDGFLWMSAKGGTRTTRQAFTVANRLGPYGVRKGDDVMVSYVAGWAAALESFFAERGDAYGVMRAGVGWDVYHLCPEKALAAFEASAKFGSAIGAYNAAVMRLERAAEGDRDAAMTLLSRAEQLGDAAAKALRERLAEMPSSADANPRLPEASANE